MTLSRDSAGLRRRGRPRWGLLALGLALLAIGVLLGCDAALGSPLLQDSLDSAPPAATPSAAPEPVPVVG